MPANVSLPTPMSHWQAATQKSSRPNQKRNNEDICFHGRKYLNKYDDTKCQHQVLSHWEKYIKITWIKTNVSQIHYFFLHKRWYVIDLSKKYICVCIKIQIWRHFDCSGEGSQVAPLPPSHSSPECHLAAIAQTFGHGFNRWIEMFSFCWDLCYAAISHSVPQPHPNHTFKQAHKAQ